MKYRMDTQRHYPSHSNHVLVYGVLPHKWLQEERFILEKHESWQWMSGQSSDHEERAQKNSLDGGKVKAEVEVQEL